jgi:hypothetical protein
VLQLFIGGHQVGRAVFDTALELVIRGFEQAAATQHLHHAQAPLTHDENVRLLPEVLTTLGEVAHPAALVRVDECATLPLAAVRGGASVQDTDPRSAFRQAEVMPRLLAATAPMNEGAGRLLYALRAAERARLGASGGEG